MSVFDYSVSHALVQTFPSVLYRLARAPELADDHCCSAEIFMDRVSAWCRDYSSDAGCERRLYTYRGVLDNNCVPGLDAQPIEGKQINVRCRLLQLNIIARAHSEVAGQVRSHHLVQDRTD